MAETLIGSLKQSCELIKKSNIKDAINLLKSTARNYPRSAEPLNILGELYMGQNKFNDALECFERSIKINVNDSVINFYLGLMLEKKKETKAALEAYKKSVDLNPSQGHVYYCIGRLLKEDNQNVASSHYLSLALKLLPTEKNLNVDIAYVFHTVGMSREAAGFYKKLMENYPHEKEHLSSLIFVLHKIPETNLLELKQLAELYYSRYLAPIKPIAFDHGGKLNSDKPKLKLGFVSADFHKHPAAFTLLSIFERMNKDQFSLNLYYNNLANDYMTEKFQNLADSFTHILRLDAETAARKIHADGIDILFDLSGFTSGERLEIFRHRPAPLQVSHLGFFGTLGMPEIDYIIADDCVVKEGEQSFYTEKVYKFNHKYVHCNQQGIPDGVQEPPCIKNGYITFGSFNTFHKISRRVIDTWIDVLKSVPNSKILFDSRSIKSDSDRKFFSDLFKQSGIDLNRVEFRSSFEREDFLKSYNDVDIALDPFPFTGGTSTIESLMMGVPAVTIMGNKWSGRMSSSTLSTINHQELIAHNEQEYKNKLVELASDPIRLVEYRKKLREELLSSKLNIESYVREFERAIKEMWKIKCDTIR